MRFARPDTRLHLLGVTRTENLREFERMGVASFDSTSPLRQAFKDDRDNYYTPWTRTFTAVRIPRWRGTPSSRSGSPPGKCRRGGLASSSALAWRPWRGWMPATATVPEALDDAAPLRRVLRSHRRLRRGLPGGSHREALEGVRLRGVSRPRPPRHPLSEALSGTDGAASTTSGCSTDGFMRQVSQLPPTSNASERSAGSKMLARRAGVSG